MNSDIDEKSTTANDENVPFSQVTAVATEWILDFFFVSLCRQFKEGNLEGFKETMSNFESISKCSCLRGRRDDKRNICAFLSCVMHGKQLDVSFEDDDSVMPLMSAAKLWSDLKHTVLDESLFQNMTYLLLVQSVVVCLEKGQGLSASSALKWFEDNFEFPRNLRGKLTTVVSKRDIYHPFVTSFSFTRLLETIHSYLDAYLEKNPSDYLIKAATKEVPLSENVGDLKDVTQHMSLSETANESKDDMKKENVSCLRRKRKLLSAKTADVWNPGSSKKAYIFLRRLSKNELSNASAPRQVDTSLVNNARNLSQVQKTRKKWTCELDRKLRAGVKRHGEGRWARMLLDDDFEGRTGTMLKDRWRVLKKEGI